jgi:Predicted restriction endonuclease
MASINGDWFHSRSSSNLSELLVVRKLVKESRKTEYLGLGWSGGRQGNQTMYAFADTVGIQPSTMQTKIRSMIRNGFLREGNTCPLIWTKMGSLWDELYTIRNHTAAQKIYELTLSISLAIYSFNDEQAQYSINPAEGDMPLKFLFNTLDKEDRISLTALEALVDGQTNRVGKNISYWKRDLINANLFEQVDNDLVYTGNYVQFVNELKNFNPSTSLSTEDWKEIRDNPLVEHSPFKTSLTEIFNSISEEQNIEINSRERLSFPIIEAISEQEEVSIPEVDILNTSIRFSTSTRRVRNQTWAIRIKKKYQYTCAVPACDVHGRTFVESAHIKPDNVDELGTPHRTHILNGICLCRHCHISFDKGYFSLTDDHRIIVSPKFNEISDQHLKRVISNSENAIIKERTDGRYPLLEFIQYHRNEKFQS